MTSRARRRIAATGGVVLLSLAVFVLAVAVAQAAGASTPLRGPFGGGEATNATAADTPLRGPFGGGVPTSAAGGPAGSATNVGRGGVFVTTTPVAASTASIVGGIAVAAFAIALVAFLASGRRASRRGELAPITSLVQAPSQSPAAKHEDRERKAA